jgi:hypothetical protein
MRITFVVVMWLAFVGAPTQAHHINRGAPVLTAAAFVYRWPLVCDPALPNKVQFRWIANAGEAVNQREVEDRLRAIAEQVNWLFWRDSDSHTEARLPAWAVTADCKLDILYGDAPIIGSTIPDIGSTKLIEISPQDDSYYCGWATIREDSRPGPENENNLPSFATAIRRCLGYHTVAHEFLHSIGAVQMTAPHSDGRFHSRQLDIMGMRNADFCGDYSTIDCGNDDYFSLTPGDRFTDRWNSADSIFLVSVPKHLVMAPLHMRCETC